MFREQLSAIAGLGLFGLIAGVPSAAAQNVDMGSTFHKVESTSRRVVTRFDDGYAVTTGESNGLVWTQLFSGSGVRLARMQHTTSNRRLDVEIDGSQGLFSVVVEGDHQVSKDWQNVQLHRLWLDGQEAKTRGLGSRITARTWQGPWLRLKPQSRGDLAFDPDLNTTAVETEYDDLIARTTRTVVRAPLPRVSYATYVCRIYTKAGQDVGMIQWFQRSRVVTWSFANGHRGAAPEWRIPGGLRFTPRMAWANVQAAYFVRNPPKKQALGAGLRRPASTMSPLGGTVRTNMGLWTRLGRLLADVTGVQRLLSLRSPQRGTPVGGRHSFLSRRYAGSASTSALSAGFAAPMQQNSCDGLSDGCTGLHWLDNTIFRECCDDHDKCFERNCAEPCGKQSWLLFWQRWECTVCNLEAVLCFATGGGDGGLHPDPPPDGQSCQRTSWAEWCPPECQVCTDPP